MLFFVSYKVYITRFAVDVLHNDNNSLMKSLTGVETVSSSVAYQTLIAASVVSKCIDIGQVDPDPNPDPLDNLQTTLKMREQKMWDHMRQKCGGRNCGTRKCGTNMRGFTMRSGNVRDGVCVIVTMEDD